MKLHLWKRTPALPPLPEGEEREALKNQRQYIEEHGSINAIFKKMGRENLDEPLRRN